jgi:hypothetical protein
LLLLPDWLARVAGEAALLLVAPHGGRRARASALELDGPRKVNDLHTAELTFELAARLRARAIVNRSEDRNRLDLNRVSDVRDRAPWLVDLLLDDTRHQLATAGHATVLFIHGWNAIQPCCDVGIGARLAGGSFVPVRQGVPTVPASFLPRLARFAGVCHAGGIGVTVGDRYPAAGRENVLQMFTARFADDPDPRIRELARLGAAGKITAVQLELAVPLRWPGPLRATLFEAMQTFAEVGTRTDGHPSLTGLDAPSAQTTAAERLAVEFHDGSAGVGGFAATERLTSGRRHGRLLLCIGAKRLSLFTGEDSSIGDASTKLGSALRCAGLAWTLGEGGQVRLEFDGPCLTFPRTDPFLDLEDGLADAELSHLQASLVWRPVADGARLGRIDGRVRHDGWSASVSAPAALEQGQAAETRPWRERRVLRVPLGPDTFLSIASRVDRDEHIEGEIVREGRVEPLLSGRVSVRNCADGLAPDAWRIEAVSRSGTLRVFGQVSHAIPVVRPAADGKVLTHFGLARFGDGERVGFGTFEQSQRLRQKGTQR